MKIKKVEQETTFKKITIAHTFEVNGKKVELYEHDYQDNIESNYENDLVWNESDLEKLTEEERDILSDNETELVGLAVEEETELE